MEIFVFAGSAPGAARTSSSILLAAGTQRLGLEPLLIQVLVEGNASVPANIGGMPFATSMIKAGRGERITDRIRARSRERAKPSPVIVDMPAQDVLETLLMLSGMQPQILVPLPEWVPDLGEPVADFRRLKDHREHWEDLKRQSGARPGPGFGQKPARLFPVGWPVGIVPDDLMAHLRGCSLLPDDEPEDSVIYPGLPRFDPSEMNFTDGIDRFALTERQIDASARIAWPLCGDIN
jgi:hypothetical protein